MHYRVPLLRQGCQLIRGGALLDSVRGSGQSRKISRYGNYALHPSHGIRACSVPVGGSAGCVSLKPLSRRWVIKALEPAQSGRTESLSQNEQPTENSWYAARRKYHELPCNL